jgi:hypothetical protein
MEWGLHTRSNCTPTETESLANVTRSNLSGPAYPTFKVQPGVHQQEQRQDPFRIQKGSFKPRYAVPEIKQADDQTCSTCSEIEPFCVDQNTTKCGRSPCKRAVQLFVPAQDSIQCTPSLLISLCKSQYTAADIKYTYATAIMQQEASQSCNRRHRVPPIFTPSPRVLDRKRGSNRYLRL